MPKELKRIREGRFFATGEDGCSEVWAGPLSGHRLVVALWNRCSEVATITAPWTTIGLESGIQVSVRDLWQHKVVTTDAVSSFSARVNAHDSHLYIFTPATTSYSVQ
ncbi:unnamed protein product [Lupinus luteus]|uniref:alpha-galactosidase n=1 Tax=Lupinus luteus TaxID=3873 RepID=A0AAV1WIV9_LUPLU